MGYFYSTQKGMGDSVGTYSYRTTSREKVISATVFMAQQHRHSRVPSGLGGQAGFSLWEVFALQWEVHMLDKVLYAR